ncbi:MAG: YhcH/YjgK/YiaL family protein [Bacteroidetes bacterium HGW-Bacteroidetes-12]|nr:MAG: YhcH/YjgK/YiaL family protein [Bacteroidetes bacterium HGW-Bacteroidetes-12]
MILDHINNYKKYQPLHPNFKLGFDFIKNFNPSNYKEGKNEILGDEVFALVANLQEFEANTKLEIHNKYIDIQFIVSGADKMGWKNRLDCNFPENEFDAEKDYQFYLDKPTTTFLVKENHFTIFFPNDAHAPLMNTENMLKIVIKIKV